MKTIDIIVIAYIALSSTLGAYWLTVNDHRIKQRNITLLDVVSNILPSVILIIPIIVFTLLDKVVIKKQNK